MTVTANSDHHGSSQRRVSWSAIEWLIYSVIAAIGVILVVAIERDRSTALAQARAEFIEKADAETRQVAASFERYFDQIYRGLRTIARLPGVRAIDRHAINFDGPSRTAAQEVYNNLAETVQISEVYIVPVDFEPKAIDPATGKLQQPITTFDELIVGRSADSAVDQRRIRPAVDGPEEIEIHEYLLMRDQITTLQRQFADESTIKDLSYPAILGEEVVTCDNRYYSTRLKNEEDRKGLVISLPFYGVEGEMRGIVSAVVLTSAIRQQLPDSKFEIRNQHYGLGISRNEPNRVDATHAIAYGHTQPLSIRDVGGGWLIRSSHSESAFARGTEVVTNTERAQTRLAAVLIACAAAFVFARLTAQRHREIEARNFELERHVRERTAALQTARLQAEEANQAKTRFLANMSHEIRTPMTAVLGTVDLMSQRRLEPEVERHLSTIRSSGQALLDLINQLLDLSAVESGRITLSPAPHDLRAIVDDVVRLFEPVVERKNIDLSYTIDPGLPQSIWVDAGRFRQIIVNLMSNATKFTTEGAISLTVSRVPDDPEMLSVAVSDTGPGMGSADRRPPTEIFGPSSAQGAGLGLRICRSLVEQMGGGLGWRDQNPVGTVVQFQIPLRAAARHSPAVDDRPSLHLGRSRLVDSKILVVEDNPTLAHLTREILRNVGCQVEVVDDAAGAIDATARTTFDAVLMDCRLHGEDGLATTRLIRDRDRREGRPAVPIVALTANAFDWDREACIAAGMDDFLSKPFSAEQLIDVLIRCVTPATDKAVST